MPFDNAQIAECGSKQETIAPHGVHQGPKCRSKQPALPAARKSLSEWIVAWDERILFAMVQLIARINP